MRRLALILWLGAAQAAQAGPVAVSSGEHPGFTRLVFDYGATIDWHFGRSADGYEIAVGGPQPSYDLRGVFQPIGTTRLAAIWPDPGSGNLHIGIACACHAMPFEFRPGVLVIDLRDGPPPKGSSFEAMLDGSAAGALSPRPPPRPKARPVQMPAAYDWLARTISDLPEPQPPGKPAEHAPDPYGIALASQLEPLRQQLLTQISRGAAQGIVDLTLAGSGPASGLPSDFASAQIVIGGNRGSLAEADQPVGDDLGAEGNACIPAEHLDLSSWGSEDPVAEQWAAAMSGLVGEFDQPDPAALAKAVRFNLFLGFGAEARQLMQSFGTDLADADLLSALSYIMDDQPGDMKVLLGQTACDGPAALWSALAETGALPKTANAAAIRLALSDLPPQLRELLGPKVAQRFLEAGDTESARAIRDAILRAGPEGATAPLALLGAEIDEGIGDPAAAEDRLRHVVDAKGSGAVQALAGLVELRARRGLPVQPSDVAALEASAGEWGGEGATDLSTAILLGKAASGDPAGAFAMLAEHHNLEPEVWDLLAHLGTDRQVLELAVLPSDAKPAFHPASAARLAQRLLDLGLPEPAAWWLDTVADQPVLQARIDLARAKPNEALALLAEQVTPEAEALQLSALGQLGDDRAAAAILAGKGDKASAQLALSRAGAWTEVAAGEAGTLQELAKAVIAPSPAPAAMAGTDEGQLARSHELVTSSAMTRDLIGALLGDQPAS